jgi:HD-GYP domain-containing protein (c-di-GMP phosphodiesterase class II)
MRTTNETPMHLTTTTDNSLPMTLDRLARHACELIGVETAYIVLRDADDPAGAVAVAGYGGCPALLGRRFSIDDGLADLALALDQPIVLNDYQALSTAVKDITTQHFAATASAPIRTAERGWGAISIATKAPTRRFLGRELEQLTELADFGAVALEHADLRVGVELTTEAGVDMLARVIAFRDRPTAQHLEHVLNLARKLGRQMELDEDTLTELGFAARLHDLGKIGIPDSILHKPGPLDQTEWAVMKHHPIWGAEMLARVPGCDGVAKIVLSHHEHFDGGGYPYGLEGDDIPLPSRIIAACDAYAAMVSDRPYRAAIPGERARRELADCAGTQFDPDAVELLLDEVAA